MSRFLGLILFCFLLSAPLRAQDEARSTPSLEALRGRLESLEARLQNGQAPVDPQNFALLKFKLEQARLFLRNIESNVAQHVLQSPYDETKTKIESTLQRAESIARSRGDAVYPALSQMHERAYIARADSSAQPYWVFVPRDYTPRKKWPLVVFLHGYGPDISKINPWIPGPETWEVATERGFILAVPYGRRNSDFVSIGEDDTLAVTDLVSARYNVDSERTFLLGTSMGGYGAHAVGLHSPERFAGVAVMCGRTDFYLWFNLQREEVPAWKRVLYDADDPRHLKRNAAQLPILMQHGALDNIVPAEHSRRLYADLKALGSPVFYREIPYATHYIYWQHAPYETAFEWMKNYTRPSTPRRVQYTTGTLRNNRSHWATIAGFGNYSELAHIDAGIKAGNVLDVKTENVSRFELRPPQQFLENDLPLTLVVNGVEEDEKYSAAEPVRWPRVQLEKELKSPQRAGPIKECYRDPFLLVYGTLQSSEDETNARRFLKEWEEFADGTPWIKADTDVTEEDKGIFNLILFGTRESNAILQQIAGKLPLELTPTGYRVGGREYSRKEPLGLQFCYPSPFSAARMVVVQSGVFWGSMLPVNHKLDLLPEFIVYDETLDPSDQTNRALVAGFFNDDWSLPSVKIELEIEPENQTLILDTP